MYELAYGEERNIPLDSRERPWEYKVLITGEFRVALAGEWFVYGSKGFCATKKSNRSRHIAILKRCRGGKS